MSSARSRMSQWLLGRQPCCAQDSALVPERRGRKRSNVLGPHIPYELLQTKGVTCTKFGWDRYRNVDLYKVQTNKQTFIFIYKIRAPQHNISSARLLNSERNKRNTGQHGRENQRKMAREENAWKIGTYLRWRPGWLTVFLVAKIWDIKGETESTIGESQGQAISTNHCRYKILKEQIDSKCRLCKNMKKLLVT
jgi:hypothetical protein